MEKYPDTNHSTFPKCLLLRPRATSAKNKPVPGADRLNQVIHGLKPVATEKPIAGVMLVSINCHGLQAVDKWIDFSSCRLQAEDEIEKYPDTNHLTFPKCLPLCPHKISALNKPVPGADRLNQVIHGLKPVAIEIPAVGAMMISINCYGLQAVDE